MDAPLHPCFPAPRSALLLPGILLFLALASALSGCGSGDGLVSDRQGNGGGLPEGGFEETLVDPSRLSKPWGKALGDLDGDGAPDALVGLYEGSIHWYRHPGWEKARIGDRFGGDDLQVADIDGDGALDVATNGGSIAWYRNPKGTGADPGEAWELRVVQAGLKGHDLAVADLDRDGRADIVSRQENGPTTVFLQSGGGEFGPWRRIDLGNGKAGTGMALGDVNRDGRLDVVGNGYWLEQPPSPDRDWPRHDFAGWHATSAVAVGDVNKDGREDIALSVGADLGHIAWFEAPQDPARDGWTEHRVGQADYVHRIHLADMDRDGDLDIVFGEQIEARDPRVGLFSNRDGGQAWDFVMVAHTGAHNVAVDDVGGDGDLDVLGADWREDTRLKLWLNRSAD